MFVFIGLFYFIFTIMHFNYSLSYIIITPEMYGFMNKIVISVKYLYEKEFKKIYLGNLDLVGVKATLYMEMNVADFIVRSAYFLFAKLITHSTGII